MMTEISLNVLDIAENSIRAGASLMEIGVRANTASDTLTIVISDNGCGMTPEQVSRVTDPFFTTRTTRKIGLGIPFFKMAAECTGGSFHIESQPGKGTCVKAVFILSHIDRMPLGDMSSTIHNLIVYHPDRDFCYTYINNDISFSLDTRELRNILGDITLNTPEVSSYIMDFLKENHREADRGNTL